jgi:hypothetical protein
VEGESWRWCGVVVVVVVVCGEKSMLFIVMKYSI